MYEIIFRNSTAKKDFFLSRFMNLIIVELQFEDFGFSYDDNQGHSTRRPKFAR